MSVCVYCIHMVSVSENMYTIGQLVTFSLPDQLNLGRGKDAGSWGY